MTPYVTPLAAIVCPRFVPLGAVLITQTPLLDPSGPGLAHLTYAGALEAAAANGARLPTREEIYALHYDALEAGTELAPVTLPDAALRAAGYQPGDPAMVTREWCERHDRAVLAAMAAMLGGEAPIANAGKHWRFGAPAGLAGLMGWWVMRVELYSRTRRGPGFVQQGIDWPHNRQHSDDATTTMLVRDVAPEGAA